jgi:hypothetical protein
VISTFLPLTEKREEITEGVGMVAVPVVMVDVKRNTG